MGDEIENKLIEFSREITGSVLEYKTKNQLTENKYKFIPVESIDYDFENYTLGWDKSEIIIDYEVSDDDFDLLYKKALNSDLCEELSLLISEKYEIDANYVKAVGLGAYIRRLIPISPNVNVEDEFYKDFANRFLSSYERLKNGLEVKWTITVWLNNIRLSSDKIEIADNVFLSRLDENDLYEIRTTYDSISGLDRLTSRGLPATAKLEFTTHLLEKVSYDLKPPEIDLLIENYINILRLFTPSNLYVVKQWFKTESFFGYNYEEKKGKQSDTSWEGKLEHRETSNFKFHIGKNVEEELKTFFTHMKPYLSKISPENYLKGNHTELAIHRYFDALLKTEVNAYKVLYSMTSLEALLSDGNSEITFKIRLRVSKLMSFFGFDSLDTFTLIKDAYNLRSKLVHGAKPTENKGKKDLLDFARKNVLTVLNLNRVCLLFFLQLQNEKSKIDIIKLIDHSLIDIESEKELADLIKKKVYIPQC